MAGLVVGATEVGAGGAAAGAWAVIAARSRALGASMPE